MASSVIEDKVLFILPKDRELQFPAMAIMQQWVNTYDKRLEKNDISGGRTTYQLCYQLELSSEDWDFWQKVGLELFIQPTKISEPDMVADFSEEKLKQFDDMGKHVCQVFGVMCGMESKPRPVIRQVKPKTDVPAWRIIIWDEQAAIDTTVELITLRRSNYRHPILIESELIAIQDEQITGVIGLAGWATYLAASMGLPTIEIIPVGRSRSWMSKFFLPTYRMVEQSKGDVVSQIDQAVASIEECIIKPCIPKADTA